MDSSAHSTESQEEALIRIRKEKAVKWVKKNYAYLGYLALAIIVWISVKVRTRNLPGLRDITTGTWTLGPDLDPFLFLRWAKYIVANGKLMALDMMRYAPLGLPTGEEYLLHPYLIAWFHKIATVFGSESVTHSAVLYPVFMFALTVIAFFFFTRKLFVALFGAKKATVGALISTAFLAIFPVLLPRTIAGIPEKESAAFLFLFLAFYFFLESWNAEGNKRRYVFGILSGLATTAMANIWGGYVFIFIVLGPAVLISFILRKVETKEYITYATWLLTSFIFTTLTRFTLKEMISSPVSAAALFVLITITLHRIIVATKLRKYLEKYKKIPPEILTIIATIIVLTILGSIIFGVQFVPSQVGKVADTLIKPATSRLIQTVAENRQPYFSEWAGNFGPTVNIGKNIPITFWLFFIGSIYLFWNALSRLTLREKLPLTITYVLMVSGIIFSRMSSGSTFDGENGISIFVYAMGAIIFLCTFGYYYYKRYKSNHFTPFSRIPFEYIFIFLFLFLGIVSARAAVRTIMVLAVPVSIIIAYLLIALYNKMTTQPKGVGRVFAITAFIVVLIGSLFAMNTFYQAVNAQAAGYVPSPYTNQWQLAMSWVRENTPEDAVFGHWWDYGYWVQSIGERATVLDGGNVRSYWNHMMGRYALTSPNEQEALEFLYAHNTTHFLIDSTDIGKYTAFSTIGSDIDYDRRSWITIFNRDNNQVSEVKNGTVYLYTGGTLVDEDIIYTDPTTGQEQLLPGLAAGLGAIQVQYNNDEEGTISQPIGVYVYNNKQYTLPLRYAFYKEELVDFGTGLEAGVYILPRLTQASGQLRLEADASLIYLSPRTVHAQLTRLYLYGEEDAFKLVHSEDDQVVRSLKDQGAEVGDFVVFQGLRGPIKIWEIEYPEDIAFKEEYLSIAYPQELRVAR